MYVAKRDGGSGGDGGIGGGGGHEVTLKPVGCNHELQKRVEQMSIYIVGAADLQCCVGFLVEDKHVLKVSAHRTERHVCFYSLLTHKQ